MERNLIDDPQAWEYIDIPCELIALVVSGEGTRATPVGDCSRETT